MTAGHAARKLARAIGLFRAMDDTIPWQVISIFLEIAASNDGVETRLLPGRVGLTQASVSRALAHLADTPRKDGAKPALHLVIRRVGSKDARQRVVEPTPTGRELAREIDNVLAADQENNDVELGSLRAG